MGDVLTLALAGNPNAGKTSIFNALTGSSQHVGNWPGKTVAKMEGTFRRRDIVGRVVDLPGTYSLSAFSPEEVIARDYLLTREAHAVINVVDATNLERNLYLTAQLLELGLPLILALNVMDSARSQGLRIDVERLSTLLGGAPVVETVGHRGRGMDELIDAAAGLVGIDRAQLRLVA
ncbi:MAG: FeoB small GTPase domain-containing protein [Candidatus Limnocylindrales bacterium]